MHVAVDSNVILSKAVDGNKLIKFAKTPQVISTMLQCTLGAAIFVCGVVRHILARGAVQRIVTHWCIPRAYESRDEHTPALLARHNVSDLYPLFQQHGIDDGVLPYIDAEALSPLDFAFTEHKDAIAFAIAEYIPAHRKDLFTPEDTDTFASMCVSSKYYP
jgi:hypothetical protein